MATPRHPHRRGSACGLRAMCLRNAAALLVDGSSSSFPSSSLISFSSPSQIMAMDFVFVSVFEFRIKKRLVWTVLRLLVLKSKNTKFPTGLVRTGEQFNPHPHSAPHPTSLPFVPSSPELLPLSSSRTKPAQDPGPTKSEPGRRRIHIFRGEPK